MINVELYTFYLIFEKNFFIKLCIMSTADNFKIKIKLCFNSEKCSDINCNNSNIENWCLYRIWKERQIVFIW